MHLTTVLEMQGEPDHTENQEPALSMTYAASACGEWRRAGIWTSATFTIWQLWQSLEPPSLPVTNRHGRRRTGRMSLPRGCGAKPSIDQPALPVAAMYNSRSASPTKCLSFGGDVRLALFSSLAIAMFVAVLPIAPVAPSEVRCA